MYTSQAMVRGTDVSDTWFAAGPNYRPEEEVAVQARLWRLVVISLIRGRC